jgi:hypothetical protein
MVRSTVEAEPIAEWEQPTMSIIAAACPTENLDSAAGSQTQSQEALVNKRLQRFLLETPKPPRCCRKCLRRRKLTLHHIVPRSACLVGQSPHHSAGPDRQDRAARSSLIDWARGGKQPARRNSSTTPPRLPRWLRGARPKWSHMRRTDEVRQYRNEARGRGG